MQSEPVPRESRLSAPEHVLASYAGGEVVLLNLETEEYFGLDGVGAEAWELIENKSSFSTLVEVLAGRFDIDRQTLERDLRDLLGELEGHGLVRISAPS